MPLPSVIADNDTVRAKAETLSPLIDSDLGTPIESGTPCPQTPPNPRVQGNRLSPTTKAPRRLSSPFSGQHSKPRYRQLREPSIELEWTQQSAIDEPSTPIRAQQVVNRIFNRRAVVGTRRKKNFAVEGITGHRLKDGKLEYRVNWKSFWVSKMLYDSIVRIVDEDGRPSSTAESSCTRGTHWDATKVLDEYSEGNYKAYHLEWLPGWVESSGVEGGLVYDYLEQLAAGSHQ
ncbi:hypothetical protein TWF481_010403 [Arthrobotrys musiformis]|uniref:Chromo domain-containing protein n=1 Tax=Arthrobotrys musiformis TaxID=47236 RepID=A0AAV9W2V1_9PEZI